ncbi:MAG TPA: prepilin-type N-terminal cleavage/methylation domain-containing protein [Anaerohalosphaeraceae bacterium]|nr:prepilin-type N-terminal cleavage/methylation domain-containing protein [Anaerohalosphaeraceae bacterium]HOL89990.1 prepilin-type N-terminal cleavage/methylation domain-containing protein [Anaerohalosphaeraceae bacterium]HPP56534.1 prepilin-type N-terminal cleavage/methylation domain-containing protein [Anaerohalosphaeraceae bacterium]
MSHFRNQNGFSLTEVLLATGILAIGFVLIATIFPAGIKLTAMAAEKTLAPAMAEEARAAVRLYDVDADKLPNSGEVRSVLFSAEYLSDKSLKYFFRRLIYPNPFNPEVNPLPAEGTQPYENLMAEVNRQIASDLMYPSLPKEYFAHNPAQNQRYCWAVLCRKDTTAAEGYQIRIFLCRWRKELRYYGFDYDKSAGVFTQKEKERPMPLPVRVNAVYGRSEVTIESNQPVYPQEICRQFFPEGAWVVEDRNGHIYQIIKRDGTTLLLNRNWQSGSGQSILWVVPPAVDSSRNPCMEVL